VADLQRIVARLFRAALWSGIGLVTAAGVIELAGFERAAPVVALIGVGIVVAAPFGVLIGVVALGRRTPTARWAAASLLITVLGYLLAR